MIPCAEDGDTSEAGTHSLWMSHLLAKVERHENAATLLYIFPLIGVLSSSGAVVWRQDLIARLQQDGRTQRVLLPEGVVTGLPRAITGAINRTPD